NQWAQALATKLGANGFSPESCVSHYRGKITDPAKADDVIKTMGGSDRAIIDSGVKVWRSGNIDQAMNNIHGEGLRAMDVNSPFFRTFVVAPDYIREQAVQARSETDPEGRWLQGVPVTMLDLSLRRFRKECDMTTEEILGSPVGNIDDLRDRLAAVRIPSPGSSVTGAT